jgi:hypothetical protein
MVNARICPIGKPQGSMTCVTRVVRDAGQPGCAESDAFDEAAQGGGCRDTVGGYHSDRLLARTIVHDCEQSITRTHQFRDVEKRSVRADRHSVDVRLESGQLTNTIRGAAQATLAGNGGWSRAIESAVRTDKMRCRPRLRKGHHARLALENSGRSSIFDCDEQPSWQSGVSRQGANGRAAVITGNIHEQGRANGPSRRQI